MDSTVNSKRRMPSSNHLLAGNPTRSPIMHTINLKVPDRTGRLTPIDVIGLPTQHVYLVAGSRLSYVWYVAGVHRLCYSAVISKSCVPAPLAASRRLTRNANAAVNARYLVLAYQKEVEHVPAHPSIAERSTSTAYIWFPTNHEGTLHITSSSSTKGRSTSDPLQVSLGCRVEPRPASCQYKMACRAPRSHITLQRPRRQLGSENVLTVWKRRKL